MLEIRKTKYRHDPRVGEWFDVTVYEQSIGNCTVRVTRTDGEITETDIDDDDCLDEPIDRKLVTAAAMRFVAEAGDAFALEPP